MHQLGFHPCASTFGVVAGIVDPANIFYRVDPGMRCISRLSSGFMGYANIKLHRAECNYNRCFTVYML